MCCFARFACFSAELCQLLFHRRSPWLYVSRMSMSSASFDLLVFESWRCSLCVMMRVYFASNQKTSPSFCSSLSLSLSQVFSVAGRPRSDCPRQQHSITCLPQLADILHVHRRVSPQFLWMHQPASQESSRSVSRIIFVMIDWLQCDELIYSTTCCCGGQTECKVMWDVRKSLLVVFVYLYWAKWYKQWW